MKGAGVAAQAALIEVSGTQLAAAESRGCLARANFIQRCGRVLRRATCRPRRLDAPFASHCIAVLDRSDKPSPLELDPMDAFQLGNHRG
jgi:hypothetical protein